MILQNVLPQMLFGAMAGYITNFFAIEMLFERRFGLGGVIPRTKEQFAKNISELCERDIITKKTIEKQVSEPEFEKALMQAAKYFFDKALKEKVPSGDISRIPGMDDFLNNVDRFADKNLRIVLEQLKMTLDEHVSIEQILNEEQIKYATEHIFDELLYAIEDTDILRDFVTSFVKQIIENDMQSILDAAMSFIEKDRDKLEQMFARSINSGLSKMGPMMAMLAGGLSLVTTTIPKDIVDYLADRDRIEAFIKDKAAKLSEKDDGFEEMKLEVKSRLTQKREEILSGIQAGLAKATHDFCLSAVIEAVDIRSIVLETLKPEIMKVLLADVDLKSLYEKAIQSKAAGAKIKDRAGQTASEYVKNNSGQMFSGRISGFVKDNLDRYTEDEMKEMARDFIGRNLKPITYFGGFLGMIAGFFLSFIEPGGMNFGWERVLIYMTGFAIVGWATNAIAIGMLFRPYKKYRLIPFFSPGYIMKNKAAFASSLGILMDEEILSGDAVKRWFSENEDDLKKRAKIRLTENGYEALRSLLSRAQDDLVRYAVDFEKDWLEKNKDVTADKLAAMIGRQELKPLLIMHREAISRALVERVRSEENRAHVSRAVDGALGFLSESLLKYLSRKETLQGMAGALYKSVDVLRSIPFVPQSMIEQIVFYVLESFVTDELPALWEDNATAARDILIESTGERHIGWVAAFCAGNLDKQRVSGYILNGKLRGDISDRLSCMSQSEAFIQSEIRSCSMILGSVISHETFLFGKELADYILEQVSDAFLDTLKNSAGILMKSAGITQVTEEQVMKLDAKSIHRMFDSFMHRYFSAIRYYGLFGAVFGISTVSSVALIFAYWLWCIQDRIKKAKRILPEKKQRGGSV